MFVTVFYGAMVAEGIIALIWTAGAIAFFWNREGEGTGLTSLKILGGGNSLSVYEMYVSLLGKTGGIIAILGVIICPITSGDTAFRSTRMLLLTGYVILWTGAVYLSTNYGKEKNRCWIAVIPAVFMSAVCITYLLYAPECFNLGQKSLYGFQISYSAGIFFAVIFLCIFLCTACSHPATSFSCRYYSITSRRKLTGLNPSLQLIIADEGFFIQPS